ncbi:MAG: hypothetical protein NXI04_09330 [Planctomycetaceae bacterium]|nr:hypothetical protein [Planctomycetaceae bacterium]
MTACPQIRSALLRTSAFATQSAGTLSASLRESIASSSSMGNLATSRAD